MKFLVVGFWFLVSEKKANFNSRSEAPETKGSLAMLGMYDGFGITRDC